MKISKEQAGYRTKSSDFERCGNCSMFRSPNSCTLVTGEISAMAWCQHYARAR